jgi:FkbM family methyltransferase
LLAALVDQSEEGQIRRIDKPLVLYGAGSMGSLARDYLDHIGQSFNYVVDANATHWRHHPTWDGVPVLFPGEVPAGDRQSSLLAVCISTVSYAPVLQELLRQGWQDVVPFYDLAEAYRGTHPLSNGWFAGRLTGVDQSSMTQVLTQWDDSLSRAHHLQFAAWRVLRQEWTFTGAPITLGDRYFIPQVRQVLTGRERFLDLGAHHGEVCLRFLDNTAGLFDALWAVEPDPRNRAILKKALSEHIDEVQQRRVDVVDQVVAGIAGQRRYCDGLNYACQMSQYGSRQVEVQTLEDLEFEPTFVKLHLEGSELEVLKGGVKMLQRARPLITATAYHNRQGLWEFPQWLMDNLPDYRFWLRLHGWCGTGLVIYAVPEERF